MDSKGDRHGWVDKGHRTGTWNKTALAYNWTFTQNRESQLALSPGTPYSSESSQQRTETIEEFKVHNTSKGIPCRRYIYATLAMTLLLAIVFAAFSGFWIFFKGKSTDKGETFTEFEIELTLNNSQYSPEMGNTSSDAFISTAVTMCEGVDEVLNSSEISNQYKGCLVTDLRPGSVIVTLIMVIAHTDINKTPTHTFIRELLIHGVPGGPSNTLGPYQIKADSVTIASHQVQTNVLQTVRCGTRPVIQHATLHDQTGDAFGDTVTVTCVDGYNLNGSSFLKCRAHNTWGTRPVCAPVTCPNFTYPTNSIVYPNQSNDLTFGSKVTFSCEKGFVLGGQPEMTCQANGHWSAKPRCDPIVCMNITVPEHGRINASSVSGHVFPSVLRIQCNQGFDLNGSGYSACLPNSTWSTAGTCHPIVCSDFVPTELSFITNGEEGHDRTYKSKIKIKCVSGYEMDGQEEFNATCQADKTWSSFPDCKPIDCGQPIWPSNVSIPTSINTAFNETVTIACENGYTLDGSTEITCKADKSWSTMPTCSPKDCGTHLQITNGTVVQSTGTTFGDTVEYECSSGYSFKDTSSYITCTAYGTWSSYPECSQIECPLINIKNGHVEGNGRLFNDVNEVICNNGFEVNESSIITCKAGGLWSGSPRCVPLSCTDSPIPPQNGYFSQTLEEKYHYGQSIPVECNSGYFLQSNKNLSCKTDGNWSAMPQCLPVTCPMFSYPPNSHHEEGINITKHFNESIAISCEDDYELRGQNVVRCQENGTWTENPTCEPIECTIPSPPEHGIFGSSEDKYLVGNELTIICNEGYEIGDVTPTTCQQNKTWTAMPSCVAITCNTLILPEHTLVVTGNMDKSRFGDEVYLSCEDGYSITGDATVTCRSSKTWSSKPECKIVTCPDLVYPSNSFKTSGHLSDPPVFGQFIEINCTEGYFMDGDSTLVCQADRSWSSKPVCEIMKCPRTTEIKNGIVEVFPSNDREYGDMAVPVCNSGYKRDDTQTVICSSEGVWVEQNACIIKDCGELDVSISNGKLVNITGTSYNSVASFECDDGYQVSGINPILCGIDELWQKKPRCVKTLCEPLETPPNSYVQSINETHLEINCERGYELTGTSTISCNSSGGWSTVPQCLLSTCGELTDTLQNGNQINITGGSFGDYASFKCNTGYAIVGQSTVRCLDTGLWESLPTCAIVKCDMPPAPLNGILIEPVNTDFNSTIRTACKEGYYHTDGSSTMSCLETGQWDATISCVPIQCPSLVIGNGQVVSYTDGTRYNSWAVAECNAGYQLENIAAQLTKCDSSGHWDDDIICALIDCGHPLAPDNGMFHTYSDTTFGSTIDVVCDPGYASGENNFTRCEENGDWTNSVVCEAIDCGEFVPGTGTSVVSGLTTYRSVALVTCQSTGVTVSIECSADGTWVEYGSTNTFQEIDCSEEVTCGFPDTIENGRIVDATGIKHMDTFDVKCDPGFEVDGSVPVVCSLDGNWTVYPECKKVDCGNPTPPQNAKPFSTGSNLYGATFIIVCQDGYTTLDTKNIECLENGSWSEGTECVVDCGEYTVSDKMTIESENGTIQASTITLSCIDGYNFFDATEDSVRCMANGLWEGRPICIDAPPGDPYIYCIEDTKVAQYGTSVTYEFLIREISVISSIEIKQNDMNPEILTSPDSSQPIELNNGLVVNLTGNAIMLDVPVECVNEGSIRVSVNSGVNDIVTLTVISLPTKPEINGPTLIYREQLTELTCNGNLGKDSNGETLGTIVFEYKLQDSTEFIKYTESEYIHNNETTGDDCLNFQSWKLELHPTAAFNNSIFRCSLLPINGTILSSDDYPMILEPPSVYFANLSQTTSLLIGESLRLACHFQNIADTESLSLYHNDERIGGITSSGSSDGPVSGQASGPSGHLVYEIPSVACSNKGAYRCDLQKANSMKISTELTVAMKRKPELPELHVTIETVENLSPWADNPTTCVGDLGYPMGEIQLEANVSGEFEKVNLTIFPTSKIEYTNNDDECSSTGSITYFNVYDMSWNGATMRCSSINDHVMEYSYRYAVSQTLRIVPDTFCDGKAPNAVLEHPFVCAAQVTCATGRISPRYNCKTNECYNWVTRLCESCSATNKCPEYTTSIPSPPSTTKSPVIRAINCPQKVFGSKGDTVTFTCELTGDVIELDNLRSMPVAIVNDVTSPLNTSDAMEGAEMTDRKTFTNDFITVEIMETSIKVTVHLNNCSLNGNYRVQYTKEELLQDSSEIAITASAYAPDLSKSQAAFYRDQEMEITCSGHVGNPKADMAAMLIRRDDLGNVTLSPTSSVESQTESNCGFEKTITYAFYAHENMNQARLYCEVIVEDGERLRSDEEVIQISEPIATFGDDAVTFAIGASFEISCSWQASFSPDTKYIKRRKSDADEYDILVSVYPSLTETNVSGITTESVQQSGPFVFSIVVRFSAMRCMDEGEYICDLTNDNDNISYRVRKFIYGTAEPETPILTLPNGLVNNSRTLIDSDFLTCTANVGYRKNLDLRFEYFSETPSNFVDFDLGVVKPPENRTENCTTELTIKREAIPLDSTWDNDRMRCVVYDVETGNMVSKSTEKQIQLIEDHCDGANDETYTKHPHNCNLYIRCHTSGFLSVLSCDELCAEIVSAPQHAAECVPCSIVPGC